MVHDPMITLYSYCTLYSAVTFFQTFKKMLIGEEGDDKHYRTVTYCTVLYVHVILLCVWYLWLVVIFLWNSVLNMTLFQSLRSHMNDATDEHNHNMGDLATTTSRGIANHFIAITQMEIQIGRIQTILDCYHSIVAKSLAPSTYALRAVKRNF